MLFKLLPEDGSVVLQPITQQYGVFVLAGPKSRDVLAKLTRTGLSNADFPWLSGKLVSIGRASAHALRVNFVGELGWELHHPIEQQNLIFDLIMEAGAAFGIRPFGIRAMTSMAIEKSYRLIPRELSIEYTAWESGLARFVHPDKGDFIGREALLKQRDEGLGWNYVTLEIGGVRDADARGNEAIYRAGELVGRATHGGYGWRVGKSLALAMVRPEHAAEGTELEIRILGDLHPARVIGESPFDPENAALRTDG